ncbi:MAG: GNAT family N-acetyltransferase [Oscillibacter sp.]|nr:GNAT family N-acetyltransferase [Oscillibacter sp.]
MEWILRKAVPADQPQIEALFIEMLQTIYQKADVEGYESGYLDKFFCNQGDWVCVAEADGKVIAFLSIEEHHKPEKFLYLDDCSVSRDYRNRGVGTELLKAAERYAKDRDISKLVLHVEKSNIHACALYKRIGFEIADEEENRFRMVKKLA